MMSEMNRCTHAGCFESDDEDDVTTKKLDSIATYESSSNSGREDENAAGATPVSRDPSCGVLAFHTHTETSLLIHVKNNLSPSSKHQVDCNRTVSTEVLELIDEFCWNRHWMMHMGPQKGDVVINYALEKSINLYRCRQDHQRQPFIIMELGTYCGYSTIMLAQRLVKEFSAVIIDHEPTPFFIYTFELNQSYANIARELIDVSGMSKFVQVLLLPGHHGSAASTLHHILLEKKISSSTSPQVHFLFVDHDKKAYLEDLRSVEDLNMLQKDSIVCADNVIFASITNYVEYMQEKQQKGLVETETIPSFVEYCSSDDVSLYGLDTLRDGVGEFF